MRGALLLPLAILTTAFAGCLGADNDAGTGALPDVDAWTPDLEFTLPDGESAWQYVYDFPMSFPYRIVYKTPSGVTVAGQSVQSPVPRQVVVPESMQVARDYLATTLESMGLEVVRQEYSPTGTNVLGIQPGTRLADQWVVLSCHYDTAEESVHGAWDDGAGCAALLEMGRTFSTMTWNRTVVYAFFDEEEQGLVGSRAFVSHYLADENLTLAANLNFDPPSLNWPCRDAQGHFPVKIILSQAKIGTVPGYAEMAAAVAAGLNRSGVPPELVDYEAGIPIATVNGAGVTGTSDHARFDAVDIPNVYIGGTPTTTVGPVAALTYLLHTPLDTVHQMETRCGGADLLKQGFQTTLDIALGTMLAYDQVAYEPAPPEAEPAA